MSLKNLLSIMCFVLAVGICFGDDQQCLELEHFPINGTYDINRRFILSDLASKVISGKGFYTGTTGEGYSDVHALGMCLPRIKPDLCADCIRYAYIDLLSNCPNQTDAFTWGTHNTLCLVRYSRTSFFNSSDQEAVLKNCNSEPITSESGFKTAWQVFMKNMIVAASSNDKIVADSSKYYATNVSPLIGYQRIYAVMQCIPGISPNDCESCLARSVSLYEQECQGKQGARIQRPACFFEWETYPIYDLIPNPDKPLPSGNHPKDL